MSSRDDLLVFSTRQWATHHDRSQNTLHHHQLRIRGTDPGLAVHDPSSARTSGPTSSYFRLIHPEFRYHRDAICQLPTPRHRRKPQRLHALIALRCIFFYILFKA
jgi:hypothetical protein